MHKKILSLLLFIIMLFPCMVFAEETEQLKTTGEEAIQPSIIKDLKIEATDVDRCKLTWHTDAEKVKIHYTCSDIDKTATSSSGSYDEYSIPFGQTAVFTLTTDDQHEPVSLSCNPSDEFTKIRQGYPDLYRTGRNCHFY